VSPTRARPITGTHVYQLPKCARAVALDLAGDRALRRPLRPEEELSLQRGRDHEADFVAALGWPEPVYPQRDFEAGARATKALLEAGVEGVLQGVLLAGGRLGIADLLRREPGASELGDFHYVVGDVKSSARARGDQILQVAFYAELLAGLQGRRPDYGYLVMKDGREERFELAPYLPALFEVVERVEDLQRAPDSARPFLSRACDTCRWSELCLPELAAADDLSLVHGMTEGLRTMLERAGVTTAAALARAEVAGLARRTRIEAAMLRRLSRAARARQGGAPLPQRVAKAEDGPPPAFVQLLFDAYEERALWLGLAFEGPGGPTVRDACPASVAEEWPAFLELLRGLPREARLCHFGRGLPTWFERHAHAQPDAPRLEERFVDLARRVRGAASWSAPVFGMPELVEQALARDPHRHGRAAAAALWAREPDGAARLRAKGRADLEDLRGLHAYWAAAHQFTGEDPS
jgi:uncharacterized protein